MNPMRCALLVCFFIFTASPALAHRINIFAIDEGGTIYTESTFAGKRPVKKGVIRVFNADGTLVFTGKTDDKGLLTFPRPEPGPLSVEVNAGMGHKSLWELDAVEGAEGTAGVADDPGMATSSPVPQSAAPAKALVAGDWKHLERVVDTAVVKALYREREETRLRDIIGGFGYIVGLLGMFAWYRSRKVAA